MHKALIGPVAITAVLLQTQALLAQTFNVRNLAFERLTIDDGLSQNYVEAIFQDSQGFMWFGTRDGLNRYDGYAFKVYSYDAQDSTSISGNRIQTIYEDRQGNIWIGTADGGLNKYDRATDGFVHFKHDPQNPHSLSHEDVSAIHEDRLGNLWIGTAYGLNRFDPDAPHGRMPSEKFNGKSGRFTRFIYRPDDPASRGHNDIRAIFEAEDGNLWLGTDHKHSGFVFFNRSKESFTPFEMDPEHPERNNFVKALYKDARGNFWVGAFSGLFRANPAAWPPNPAQPRVDRSRISSRDWLIQVSGYLSEIYAICEDDEGKLWLASTFGLFIYDMDKNEIRPLPNDPRNPSSPSSVGMTAVCKDRSGVMWLGTAGQGINKLDRARQHFGCLACEPNPDMPSAKRAGTNGLRNPSLRAICEDRDSTLWIGGYDGLNRFDRKTGRFTHYPNRNATSYGGESVWAIYEDPLADGKFLWIGTEGGGLYRLDRKQEKFYRYQNVSGDPHSLNHNFVISIYRDQSGTLWVGTYTGLNRFDELSGQFKQYNYSPANPYGLSGGFVLCIIESRHDNGNVLWLATENGLNRFDPATGQFTHFFHDPRNSKSLGHNTINCLYQDRAGRLWIGTAGGLNRLILPTPTFLNENRTGNRGNLPTPDNATFIRYTEKDGLPNNFINGILEDEKGNLWLSTNKGISQFNPETERFRNYDAADGLQSREFNRNAYYQCRHGEMFFGGINGLNMFFPRELKDNPHRPPLVFTDFKILNKSVVAAKDGPLKKHIAVADEIRLSYDDRVFSFEFAALEYTVPEKNQYAYKMEGFDADWVHAGTKREAVYTNLDPGEYTFRVKGSNDDGVWNEEGASLKIIITPPWWKTWWFRMGSVLAILGLIISGHRFRTAYIKARNRALEKEVAERKQAEAKLKNSRERLRALTGHLHEVMERERISISQDIHDELGGVLTALKIDLTLLECGLEKTSAPKEDDLSLKEIRAMKQTIDATIGRMREFVRQLRPEVLDDLGLVAALEWQMQEFHKRMGVGYEFKSEATVLAVEENCAIAVFRIFQEALTNIARHASASQVVVQISQNQDHALIKIIDNGIGIPAEKLASPGTFGLLGMRERALMFGGEVDIASAPGEGTTVIIKVPLVR